MGRTNKFKDLFLMAFNIFRKEVYRQIYDNCFMRNLNRVLKKFYNPQVRKKQIKAIENVIKSSSRKG